MSRTQNIFRTTLLTIGTFWLSACTLLPETEPLKVFQFPATSIQPSPTQNTLPLALRINTPQTGFALSGPRLLVNPQDHQLSTYKGARWSDPSPTLLREHLARAFVQHGGLANISTDEHALHADMHLGSDLRRFQVVYEGGPRVVIELDARLIEPASRRILATNTFLIEQPLEDEQVPGVVKTFGIAADQLAKQVIVWVLTNLVSTPPE